MAVPIFLQVININQFDTNSSFLIGTNYHCNITSTRKHNYGNGESIGITSTAGFMVNIIDTDAVDAPVLVPEIIPLSAQAQVL